MIWLRSCTVIFFSCFLLACQPVQNTEITTGFERKTLIDLMVHKEHYFNRAVLVTGLYADGAIYFSPEHAGYRDLSYAIALINDAAELEKIAVCDGHWVGVQGIFQPYFNTAENVTEGKLHVVAMSTSDNPDCFNVNK